MQIRTVILFQSPGLITLQFFSHTPCTMSIEFSHLKLVNEFSEFIEFSEFLLDTHGVIATCGQDFIYYPWKFTTTDALLFTLVVRIAYMRSDSLTT